MPAARGELLYNYLIRFKVLSDRISAKRMKYHWPAWLEWAFATAVWQQERVQRAEQDERHLCCTSWAYPQPPLPPDLHFKTSSWSSTLPYPTWHSRVHLKRQINRKAESLDCIIGEICFQLWRLVFEIEASSICAVVKWQIAVLLWKLRHLWSHVRSTNLLSPWEV